MYEIASLEDSCVDASVVLQDPRCVLRAFRLCRCFEEPGRCPACFVHSEKAPKPPETVPVLEHSGLHGGSAPVAGATVGAHAVHWRANEVGLWKWHEFVDLNLSFEENKSGTAQIKPSAHVSSSAGDKRPPLVFMTQCYASRAGGRELRRPSTQYTSCDIGLERRGAGRNSPSPETCC